VKADHRLGDAQSADRVGGAFTEAIIKQMAAGTEQPVILPMSNPTRLAEATPADLLRWTDGRALVATGSPFAPVRVGPHLRSIGQANNALVFPGLGLGTIVSQARRVTDGMIHAAAQAIASVADAGWPEQALLPDIGSIRATSRAVAVAVARAAISDGVAQRQLADGSIEAAVLGAEWTPDYRPIVAVWATRIGEPRVTTKTTQSKTAQGLLGSHRFG
jgi:malate dehydrogenase (oxaloacetate-decarboxylating)